MARSIASLHGRITRGLRFRLTLTYLVFFTILLAFLGISFRQTLSSLYDSQLRNILNEEWGAVRGYLRIEKGKINWFYDREEPEEAIIVDRLKQIYLLTDHNGTVLEISPKYEQLGVESPQEIRDALRKKEPIWTIKRSSDGVRYLMREGLLIAEDDKPYFVAIGRSYDEGDRLIEQFTRYYSIMLPLMIVTASFLGWFMAAKALSPIDDVARTAQRITGSNLRIQIPRRGANDELDRLIDAFNRMIERLDAAFQQTKQFSTDVSHELRTPLTAIRGQLEVALLAAKTPEQYQDAILNALEDVERLSQTIRALLQLSQAESGQLALQKQRLDLSATISSLMEQFEIPAESGKVQLSMSLPPQCFAEVDRIQVERLISNLVSNAIKYTPEGGSINVALYDHGREVELVVTDTGVGIPKESLPHIFDRFYRVPGPAAEKSPERGLGLGLSFVVWIVKEHQGQVEVQSEPGEGTTFRVLLPKGEVGRPEPLLVPAEKM
jgi:two-component system OmpR family sensor kinase